MQKISLIDEHFFFRNIHYEAEIHLEPIFYENVNDYEFVNFGSIDVFTETNQYPKYENNISMTFGKSIYCVVDSEMSINFGHFVWESLVYLKQLKRLKTKFPELIFIIKNKTKFKAKLLDHYGFRYSDKINNPDNYVAFFAPISLLVNNKYSTYYKRLLDEFHYEIHRENPSFFEKDLSITYFPRHEKIDNLHYENQDRSFNTSEIQDYLKNKKNCVIFDTEHSSSWANEVEMVRRSKFIICHDGSSSAVLGFHACNSVMIILSNNVYIPSMRRFDKVAIIDKKIKTCNECYYITAPQNNFTIDSIAPILERRIVSP